MDCDWFWFCLPFLVLVFRRLPLFLRTTYCTVPTPSQYYTRCICKPFFLQKRLAAQAYMRRNNVIGWLRHPIVVVCCGWLIAVNGCSLPVVAIHRRTLPLRQRDAWQTRVFSLAVVALLLTHTCLSALCTSTVHRQCIAGVAK